jgi:mono/diheme cytochrome c family protein
LAAAIVLSGAAYWLWQREEATNRIISNPKDQAQVALGEAVYRRECATCHGENLDGQPNWQIRNEEGRLPAPPHDETGHTWHHPDAQLVELTAKGPQAFVGADYETDMPAYEGVLTETEIHAVLAFIKSRWPLEIQERQAEITRRAAEAQD